MSELMQTLRAHAPGIVAFGGSAGAFEGLLSVLPALPESLPVPVVVIVHLGADAGTGLAEALAACCTLRVVEAEDKMRMTAGFVYVAPAGYHLLVERAGTLALSADAPVHYSRPSIDVLFESIAVAFGPRAFAVLLSGASADGADGLAAIRKRGGLTWVQRPETARISLMPKEALARAPHQAVDVPEMTRILAEWGYAGA
jgi:two-component system chemotaxis response regulator CheB